MGKLPISINDGKTEQAVNASKETILGLPFKCCTIKAQETRIFRPRFCLSSVLKTCHHSHHVTLSYTLILSIQVGTAMKLWSHC